MAWRAAPVQIRYARALRYKARLHIGDGKMAGAVADGAVDLIETATIAEIARDEAEVNALDRVAGDVVDGGALDASRLSGQGGAE
jgi:hypothetical protein